ncbi:MAG: N-acetylmuramic acid 6-phosphate etherase [Bdellovibrionales bacterium]
MTKHSHLSEMWRAQLGAMQNMESILPDMSEAISDSVQRLRGTDGRIIYIGAGTSGRLGVQDGVELKPTFAWDRVAYAMAGGFEALTRSVEGAEDDRDKARAEIKAMDVGLNDVCVAVAASGTTPYTLAACEEARNRGALTIGMSNKKGAPLLEAAEHSVFLDSGEEVLVGSTRMAAGTLQKTALNIMSTQIMMDLGRVYQGRMVFVQVTCDKLVNRAIGLIQDMSGCDEDAARSYLGAADRLDDIERRVPSAILSAAVQMTINEAHAHLVRHEDHFGDAYEGLPGFTDLSSRLDFLKV